MERILGKSGEGSPGVIITKFIGASRASAMDAIKK
jgi:hypothetical protein